MKLSFIKLYQIVTTIFLIFILFSCNKEADLVGLDTQPESDKLNIGFSDTTTIIAITQIDDSLKTGYQYTTNLLGSYIDPIFGPVTASFCTQVKLSSTSVTFGTQPVLDSIVLTVAYSGIYPTVYSSERSKSINIKVYELAQDIYKDSSYYSFSAVQHHPSTIANKNIIFNTKDSVNVNGVMFPPHMRIRLNDQFGYKLLYAPSSNLTNDDQFLKFIKGLYIKATQLNLSDVNKGFIAYLSPLSYPSNLTLYYRTNATDTNQKTYNFVISESCARYNTFDHANYQYAINNLRQQIAGDTSAAQNSIYFQSAGGTKVFLKFPYFKSWAGNNKYVLNQATLRFKVESADARYPEPNRIILFEPDSAGGLVPLLDASEGDTYQGGYYNSTTGEYQFRVTRYLQKLINTGAINRGIVAILDSRRTTANRVVIKGTDKNSPNRIKLELIFTKVR